MKKMLNYKYFKLFLCVSISVILNYLLYKIGIFYIPELYNRKYVFIILTVVSIFTSYKISTDNVEGYNKFWFELNNFMQWLIWITDKNDIYSGVPANLDRIKNTRSPDEIFKSKFMFLLIQLGWLIPIIILITGVFSKEYNKFFVLLIVFLLIITWLIPYLIFGFYPKFGLTKNKAAILDNIIKILYIVLSLLVILLTFNNGNIYVIFISLILSIITLITLIILIIYKKNKK